MKKGMKKCKVLLCAAVAVFMLAACQKEELFDAKGYVQGVLDACYHGEYAAHAEDVGQTEDEIREGIESADYEEAENALKGTAMQVTEEHIAQYLELITGAYKKIEYTVGEAVEDENGNFTVEVSVVPLGMLDSLEEIFTNKLTEAVNNGTSEEEYMDIFLVSIKESIDAAETFDPVTVTFHVNYTEDADGNRVYDIEEDDMTSFDNIAIHQQ
ncbi:MAG: hypothetical protein Q4B75_04070 [Eubacteriales bacterium]|nr:hypothetical protein [Eubacteriales bacterium]